MRITKVGLSIAIASLAMAGLVREVSADNDRMAALESAAKKEGQITWYTSHFGAEVTEEVGQAFMKKYPAIKVNIVRTNAGVAYQRVMQDIKAGQANADVFGTNDAAHFANLKKGGHLAQYDPINLDKISPEFRGFDKDRYYFPTFAALVFIAYNKNKVTPQTAPKTWHDLLDPKWKGQIATGHPGFSGTVATWVVQMSKLYGQDYIDKLEKNKPQVGRSINDTVTLLNSGERTVGISQSPAVMASIVKGNPIGISYPTDGSMLQVGPSAILKNAPHPNAARLFLEFLLDVEYGKLCAASGGYSIRPEVAPPPGLKALSEIKVIQPTVDEQVSGTPKAIERWQSLFGG